MCIPSRTLALALTLIALAACTSTTPTPPPAAVSSAPPPALPNPSPPASPTQDGERAIHTAIQALLERYSTAYNTNDAALLDTTYDTSNPPLRRLFRERFAAFQESVLGGVVTETYRLKATAPLAEGFVLATVERASDHFVADWPVRLVQERWVLAEPTAEQVGARIKTERDGFVFFTYPWNASLREQLIDSVLAARDTVKAKLGTVPDRPVEVVIRPTFGTGGVEAGVPTAYYTTTSQDGDRLVIYGPQSLAFVFYDSAKGWHDILTNILVHEYTHLVTNRSFVPLSVISDWMSEGIAEYVSDYPRPALVRAALQRDRMLPIQAPAATPEADRRDLEHLDMLGADRYLGYGLSYELVAYIVERHGGLDGFWTLCRTYAKNGNNLDGALQESFGVPYAAFDADWHAWLRQRYES